MTTLLAIGTTNGMTGTEAVILIYVVIAMFILGVAVGRNMGGWNAGDEPLAR
jgi:hypothetical protein